jgi:hypothetical protein
VLSPASVQADLGPSITTWTRLEPQPRDASMARSLQAQLRDPLWMLARQWQVGEFAGHDAGSPVQATMGIEAQPLTGYRPGPPGSAILPFDSTTPLEVRVERTPTRFSLRGSIQLGLYFESLIAASGIASPQTVIDGFRAAFPIARSDPAPALAGAAGLQVRALAAGRVVDGETLYASAVVAAAGGTPSPPLPPQATDPAVAPVLAAFVTFRKNAFSEPSNDATWQPSELDYAFAVEAASTDQSAVLEADTFGGGHLDWYGFSLGAGAAVSTPQAPTYTNYNFLPLHVTFRGMPESRWWNFEDSLTDFGQLDTEHVDLAKMLVMEFALVYGSEWFFVPVPTPLGTLQRVTTLVVTDTFGERTLIRPVEQLPVIGSNHPWSMFKIAGNSGLSDFIVMAPTVGLVDDAEPLEDVLFLRDNMAAMAWAVEQKLQGALDRAVDGYEQYLVRLNLNGPPAEGPSPAGSPPISYVLEQAPPDNWIPLVPIQTPAGALMFRRGTLEIPTASGIISLQPHSSILAPGSPFFLTDRVVTPIGAEVQQYLRRTRSPDGTTLTWTARQSLPGRGTGWSGLRFDFLRSVVVASS